MFAHIVLKDFYFSIFPARIAAPYAPAYLPSGRGVTVLPNFLERSSAKYSFPLNPPVITHLSAIAFF